MSRRTQQFPEALVLRWDSQTLRVLCPYCLYSHGHGFSQPQKEDNIDQAQPGWKLRMAGKRRRSDCQDSETAGEYLFVFPQTSNLHGSGYGWEVDRESCKFITVNHQGAVTVPINDCRDGRTLLPQYQEQHQITFALEETEGDVGELDVSIGALSLGSGAGEQRPKRTPAKSYDDILEVLYSSPAFRRTMYFSHCTLREIQELELLYRRYPDDRLVGCVDNEGNTGALLAATEENGQKTLRWLQDRGDSIHQTNHYGRSPLMEAALWGRFETVQYLIRKGADHTAHDGNGMQAADLVAETQRNTNERAQRSNAVYREPPNAGKQRKQIKALLERLTSPVRERENIGRALQQRRAFFGRKSNGDLEIYRPQQLLELPLGSYGLQKAFATLDRGSNYPYVNAMSGYSHTGWPNVLDNQEWTDKAEGLRALVGLSKNRSAASHVEPQLLAYLLHRHSLHQMCEDEEDYRALASAMPEYSLQPIITVSKPDLCVNCLELFERFKKRFPGSDVIFHCVGDSVAAPLRERA